MVSEGVAAPDFELVSQDGNKVRLSSFRGKNVVLFFYPKDGSPGCTRENCLLRDSIQDFEKFDAVAIGISRDSVESHRRFAEKHRLTHLLLSDPSGEVVKAYNAAGLFGLTKRITYVIDREGRIRKIISSLNPSTHVAEALKALSGLEKHGK
ncbi:MAG: peroxiredoxin [Candidatus Caldarchaeum sp.]|nr:peroxiredoxin [Candidatus Caldarchaeum sp.]MDW8435474.1 peroxiredoxin [Candidatus Caldarchaeum sp.]